MHKSIPIRRIHGMPSLVEVNTFYAFNRYCLFPLLTAALLLFPLFNGFGQSPNIDNPVLPGVADAGVIKFNGEYYIGGVFTDGSFYISEDLVHWEGPVHVFSMDNEWTKGHSAGDSQIHANDINYVNGTFHLYWSVNYWGKDKHVVHIGHATSPHILGPYQEPVKDIWLADRIDPHFFTDDDGKHYLYMVKFTDGNTIWARPMKDPMTFSGEPQYIFSSLPGTWETLDNRVAEGAWVIKYRNRYYMMYNTNHTATRWGNYTLGVAEAGSPLEFNHGNKYSYPVVASNQIDLQETFTDILRYSAEEPGVFRYTFEAPAGDWNKVAYNDSDWQKGRPGFGSEIVENSTTREVKTLWEPEEIWIRKTFSFSEDPGNLMLRIHHDGHTKVFLNGEQIYEDTARQYITWNFDEKAKSLLKDSGNVLAAYSSKAERSGFLDVSVFDMKTNTGDDILYSPGQPNILRGPNGFEWWLIYMANKNAERRGQFINRVHFFNKRLFVDGLSGKNTPGYHPEPSKPTFNARFNKTDRQWKRNWGEITGTWEVKNKELIQMRDDSAQALIKSKPASHYLFEAGVKIKEGAKSGIYAFWQDKQNFLKVILDPENKEWEYILQDKGKQKAFAFPLPADFNDTVYHSLRVEKNAGNFTLNIDGLPAPENSLIEAPGFSGEGVPGLYAEGAGTAFDGVLYTIGWDEFDKNIIGWGASANGEAESGSWRLSDDGIRQSEEAGERVIFKGDMLDEYEISVQVSLEGNQGSAGIYPVYTDAENYVKAAIDPEGQQLVISGRREGKSLETSKIPLERNKSYYADMSYSDFIAKQFTFEEPASIDAIRFNKTPHNRPDTVLEDIYKKVNIFYRQKDKWHPLTGYRERASPHAGFEEIAFEAVEAEALKFVNKEPRDHNFYTYKIWVNEIFRGSYHLRIAKRDDFIVFLVDGKEMYRMESGFSASQVGLFTENVPGRFNGITLFDLNTEATGRKF